MDDTPHQPSNIRYLRSSQAGAPKNSSFQRHFSLTDLSRSRHQTGEGEFKGLGPEKSGHQYDLSAAITAARLSGSAHSRPRGSALSPVGRLVDTEVTVPDYPDRETGVFDMADTGYDASSIPKAYLEAYPYPAFVLVVPIPLSTSTEDEDDAVVPPRDHRLPFTRTTNATTSAFSPIWANEKWRNLTQGNDMLDCVSIESARKLGDWISGARAARQSNAIQSQSLAAGSGLGEGSTPAARYAAKHSSSALDRELQDRMEDIAPTALDPDDSFDLNEVTPTLARSGAMAPEGFWEPEVPYEEHASTSGNSTSDTGATGIEGVDATHQGPFTMTLDLVDPGQVTLELTKTSIPIYRVGRSGGRTKVETDSYIIVTTVPKSGFITKSGLDLSRITTTRTTGAEDHLDQPFHQPASENFSPLQGPSTSLRLPTKTRTTLLTDPRTFPHKLTAELLAGATNASSKMRITPTDEIMALDLAEGGDDQGSRPLYFSSDGTISRLKGPLLSGMDDRGKPLDVNVLLATTDWSKTALGARETWPQSLKTIVSLIMQYPHQCCLWWGKDLTLIYNAHYAETIHKHPDLFGMSGPLAWQEIWESIGPLSELVLSGTPVSKEDDFLLFKQLPHQGTGTFEVYHSWMWVPVVQEDGTFGGLWNATIDTTKKVLAERRMASVREMGERTSIARTMKEFDSAVIDILTANSKDMPFAALYHVNEASSSSSKRNQSGSVNNNVKAVQADAMYGSGARKTKCELVLAGAIGIPENHHSTPSTLRLSLDMRTRDSRVSHMTKSPTLSVISSLSGAQSRRATLPSPAIAASARLTDDGQGGQSVTGSGGSVDLECWPLREALQTRRIVLVEDCSSLISGYPIRIWDELPTAAVVVPIANDSDEGIPSAVIVIGLSIRRPFDDDYESFLHVLRLQLASGIAAVRSYEAERQRIEELAALDRAKSMLFSNVSHELRTPLTLVAGPLDDLLMETKEGPKKEMLIMARRNVRRLTRLVSTLMDVSRLEAGRLKGSFRLVNLGSVTRDLAALFRGAIERAKLKYIIECDISPRDAYVDPDHWEKIMFNLIGNAMKYTMTGFVRVSLSYGPGEAFFTVTDSGVGIPASDIDLIGDRFHRVNSISRSHEGTGIGISLIKELIKLHGGVLEIESLTALESTDGSHGSTFRVRIPLGVSHLPRDAIDTDQNAMTTGTLNYAHGIVDEAMQWNRDREGSDLGSSSDSGKATSAAESQSSRGLDIATLYFKKEDVIMLVDDSFDTRRYMKSIFAPFCTVVEARDGLEALEMCRKALPHVLITDVMMPNLDGFGLLAALKEDPKLAMVPVIMLTARGGDEAKVEGLMSGADDHIEKPFNARELIARAHMQIQLGKRRCELENAFEERTAELRTVTEYSPGGIFRCDGEGEVIYANSAWFEISGVATSRPDMNSWFHSIIPLHRKRVQDLWSAMFKSDQPTQAIEWQFNNERWVMCKLIRLDHFAPGLRGILGSLMDITERKRNEEIQRLRVVEAEERRVEAEEAKHQQELLIDITSHEIRNPISSLMQCSSLVKTNLLSLQEQFDMAIRNSTPFTPTVQLLTTINEDLEALESIYQCGLAQERISNDVLSLGRIQLDMFQMFDVETDIVAEAQKVISIFQNEARMKRISLSYKIGESVERLGIHTIKTDPVRMGQVVTNLLSNGIRFTSTSSVRKIQLSYDISFDPPTDGSCVMPGLPDPPAPGQLKDDMVAYLYVAVTDTGPGLTPKELDMLFQRFSQVSPKTHTIFGGSGLGLFVCRKITDIMGGRIEVVSQHGKGSTFRFFIKVRISHSTKRSAPSDSVSSPGGRRGDGLKRPALKKRNTGPRVGADIGPKPHVLIVEDNLINQTVLARQLRHVGLTCEVANNGLEALEKIRKVSTLIEPRVGKPFDCILLDLEMPIMDGLTCLRHVREEESAGKLSLNLIIALTGNARQGQIDEAKAAGMDEVVIKPYRLDDLLVKIEDMMKLRNSNSVSQVPPSPVQPIREGVESIVIDED